MQLSIAYLEDDPAQSELLSSWFEEAGFDYKVCPLGSELIKEAQKQSFDLFLLDWELPDMSGLEVLQQLRFELKLDTPVIFITQRDSETDIVTALESGADDYLNKPVRKKELLARVNAVCRRVKPLTESASFSMAPFRIDQSKGEIYRGEEVIALTSKDYALALFLFQNFGRLLSRDEILEEVWGISGSLDTRTVDVHISRIRKALPLNAETGFKIKTVYHRGYRLEKIDA
jgi:DNA-binding response OmpR family regulator